MSTTKYNLEVKSLTVPSVGLPSEWNKIVNTIERTLYSALAYSILKDKIIEATDWALTDSGGLDVIISAGKGFIDGCYGSKDTTTEITLTDDATNKIYVQVGSTSGYDGAVTIAATVGALPSRSLLLWEAVTSGGDITGTTDKRRVFNDVDILEVVAARDGEASLLAKINSIDAFITTLQGASHSRSHAINSGTDHTGTLDDSQIPSSITRDTELTTHADLTTGVHGVGEGTVAKVADIAIDNNLSAAAQDAISNRHSHTQQAALTTADASIVDDTYGAEEAAVIENLRTRVNQLEAALQALGFIA